MIVHSVFGKWLWDNRRSTIVWAAAIAMVGVGYAAFWPTINSPAMQQALAAYPPGVLEALNYTDMSTPARYLTSTVYGLLAAILLLVYAAGSGAGIVAGDEEAGTLDLILAHPVSRASLASQRLMAFVVNAAGINLVLWLALWAISAPAQLSDISVAGFAAMHLHLLLFSIFFGAIAFGVGAAFGRRTYALGAAATIGVLGFFANGVVASIDGFEWIRGFSPFDWLSGGVPLSNGVQIGDALLLVMVSLVFVFAGVWIFTRRDVGT